MPLVDEDNRLEACSIRAVNIEHADGTGTVGRAGGLSRIWLSTVVVLMRMRI